MKRTEELKAKVKGLARVGLDGVSCSHEWEGTVLHITSASGTTSADLKGDKGDRGERGFTGEAGYTPIKGVDYFDGKDGTVTFDELTDEQKESLKGENGYTPQKNIDYFDGSPGYTPQKGIDYWTPTDRAQMVSDVINSLPTWEGGSY